MREIPIQQPEEGILLQPVGVVRAPVREQQFGGFEQMESVIELKPGLEELLVGIEDYSHITVLYWLSEQRTAHTLHRPQGNPSVPVVGMFACR